MRARRLENISQVRVSLKLKSGQNIDLPSGSSLENVNITNEKELEGKVHIVQDLTEVTETPGKTQLHG